MTIKINLEPTNHFREDCINISSNPQVIDNAPENTNVVIGYPNNLTPVVGDQEVEEIVLSKPLNILSPDSAVGTVEHWTNILIQNGKLSFHFLDIRLISKKMALGDFSLTEGHTSIYGNNYEFKSLLDLDIVKQVINRCNLHIQYISTNGVICSLECIKNS